MTPEMFLEVEQISHECQQDQQAEEWGLAVLELAELVRRWGKAAISQELAALPDTSPTDSHESSYQPSCEQCVNWRPTRTVLLTNGNTAQVGGFCESRAAADLEQMPQGYAVKCSFYEEEEPF